MYSFMSHFVSQSTQNSSFVFVCVSFWSSNISYCGDFEIMKEWFHCNQCLATAQPNCKYFLTECEKVFCDQCVQKAIGSCLKCGPNKCRFLELNKYSNPQAQILFKDVTDSFKKLVKVENFQKCQQRHLISRMTEEYKRLTAENTLQREKIQNLENEIKTLRDQMIQRQRHSSPLFSKRETSPERDIFQMMSKEGHNQNNSMANQNRLNDSMNDLFSPIKLMPPENSSRSSFRMSMSPMMSIRKSTKSKISVRGQRTPRPSIGTNSTPLSHPSIQSKLSSITGSRHSSIPANHNPSRFMVSGLPAVRNRNGSIASSYPSSVTSGATAFSRLDLNCLSKRSNI